MMYLYELLMFSVGLMLLTLFMYMKNLVILLDWVFLESGKMLLYELVLDYWSIGFMMCIGLVSSMIFGYSNIYMGGKELKRFYTILIVFVVSMMVLVSSSNMISMFLGWDGLGFSSFLLVSYYYSMESSINNSMVVLLFNRFGDSMLLCFIGLVLMISGSGKMGVGLDLWGVFMIYILFMGLVTKSSQFPFMSWLPKAMAAPTPVSSLVHSSTLVTAGVYLMIRFCDVFLMNKYLMYLSLITMILSGVLAIVEFDLKKIVAYSTLSQLGLMIFSIVWGLIDLVYFHMLCHAIFKSMMFMCCGIIIHEYSGWQDLRYLNMVMKFLPISIMCFLVGSSSLMGLFFMAGYFSKDLILEGVFLKEISMVILYMFYISMILSMFYSFRLIYMITVKEMFIFPYHYMEDNYMVGFLMLLVLGSIFGGFMISMVMNFISFDYVSDWVKILLFLMLFSLLVYSFISWDLFIYYNMDYYYLLKNYLLFFNSFMLVDSFWLEFYGGYKFIYLISINKVKDYSVYILLTIFFLFIMF